MSFLTTQIKFRNGKLHITFTHRRITGMSNNEINGSQNGHRKNSDSESKPHNLTQEAVHEQIKNYIAPLTKQLEDLTQLIQGISRAHHVIFP